MDFYLFSIIDGTKSFSESLRLLFHSFNKYLLSTDPRLGAVLGTRDTKQSPGPLGVQALVGETKNYQGNTNLICCEKK